MAETDYPLLVFPEPTHAERAKRFGGGGKIKTPSAAGQAKRLVPEFQRLQDAMENQRLALQDNPLGIQPEQAVVLETIGSIQNFINAVNRIPGLEWLGEYELGEIPADHGFEDEDDADKSLKGLLFLVMTDQSALNQIQHLFKSWARDCDAQFPFGLAPLKEAFKHLRTIRPWGVEDRIRETGILADWRERLEFGEDHVPFQAELWFRMSPTRRRQAESLLRNIIETAEGQVIQQCLIPDIAYHAILGRLPRRQVQSIIEAPESFQDIKLLQCEDLMRAHPTGQCAVPVPQEGEAKPVADGQPTRLAPPPDLREADPVIALFDGMPLAGHRLLDKCLTIDDPDGYEAAYLARERVHGTGMASLICHGDLNLLDVDVDRPVYVRPILQPRRRFDGQFEEVIPDNVLPVDLVHRAVRRLFEGENGDGPAAPAIRIISLSICDPDRPFVREMSAWARLLDWLAWKYEVLFIVSAGNHARDLELEVPRTDFHELSPEQLEQAILKALAEDTRNRRLLSPAETLNGLTVGGTHEDGGPSLPESHPAIDPFVEPGVPNVVSAHGPGYRRAIKPDVLMPGGRQLLLDGFGFSHTNANLRLHHANSPPGQRIATPGLSGELDRTTYTRGTSNAAALTSHWAGAVLRLLEELRGRPGGDVLAEYDAVLTKALLAHSASWGNTYERFAVLRDNNNRRAFKEYLSRFLGYGSGNVAKVMSCTDQRVTILGVGQLDDGEGAEFALPLPPSLSTVNERRRLTITLAWLSPVSSASRSYRVAHLWFDPKNEVATQRKYADHRAAQRGTLQHEILEGSNATAFQDGDSINLKISCRADASDIPEPIRFGLAVTLEVAEGLDIPIYQEVRDRLAVRVPVKDQSR